MTKLFLLTAPWGFWILISAILIVLFNIIFFFNQQKKWFFIYLALCLIPFIIGLIGTLDGFRIVANYAKEIINKEVIAAGKEEAILCIKLGSITSFVLMGVGFIFYLIKNKLAQKKNH